MANTLAPFGLRAIGSLNSTTPNFQTGRYFIKKSYATAIGFGDLVVTLTGGNIGYVGAYTAGTSHVLGVFAGCEPYFDTTLQQVVFKPWYAGTESPSGDIAVQIIDDPNTIFQMQVSGGPMLYNTDRGKNADITNVAGVNTSTGMSGMALDYSTVALTGTLPLRMIGLSTGAFAGVDPTMPLSSQTANNYVNVVLNTSERFQTTGL